MSPRDIRNLAASVRQRLFNVAKQRGDDFEPPQVHQEPPRFEQDTRCVADHIS
jgi:hypothetical protein